MGSVRDRSRGAFEGFVLGDCLGSLTDGMSAEEVVSTYGMISEQLVVERVGDSSKHPPLLRSNKLNSLGSHLSAHGGINTASLVQEALERDKEHVAVGESGFLTDYSRILIESGTKRPEHSTTAMQSSAEAAVIAVAIGVAFSRPSQDRTLRAAITELNKLTGGTTQNWTGIALVVQTIRGAVNGFSVRDAIEEAIADVAQMEPLGRYMPGANVVARTLEGLDGAENLRPMELSSYLTRTVGLSAAMNEAVPAAFVLADYYRNEPLRGICTAAQLGGASGIIASLTGAILGAGGAPFGIEGNGFSARGKLEGVVELADALCDRAMSKRP